MKNMLQVVQAVIRRTAKARDSVEDFERSLLGRLTAMSRAHDLLASQKWHGADISAVIRQEAGNFGGASVVRVDGPHLRLNPKAALSFAMVVHELGTNALKYGALLSHDGRVDVTWQVERGAGERRLVFRWEESGGPRVQPPARRGFGSLLVERSIAYELDGSATLDYRPEGLVCVISAPLSAVQPFAAERPRAVVSEDA
jgi:two-component sensor histidine kinase